MDMFDNIYLVVCTDFHVAYGLFEGPESATVFARLLTDTNKCVFVPVKFEAPPKSTTSDLFDRRAFTVEGEKTSVDKKSSTASEDFKTRGGYL